MSTFFAMGGYAAYVWPAYALTTAVLIGLWMVSARSLRARQAEVDRAEAQSPRARHDPR